MGGMLPRGLRLMLLVSCEQARCHVYARVGLSITSQLAHRQRKRDAEYTVVEGVWHGREC